MRTYLGYYHESEASAACMDRENIQDNCVKIRACGWSIGRSGCRGGKGGACWALPARAWNVASHGGFCFHHRLAGGIFGTWFKERFLDFN